MNTPDKCPHCGAIRIEGREYACGFIFRKGVKNNPRPHECLLNSEVSAHAATREREKSTSIAFGVMKLTAEGWESECKKVAQELTETKRKLGAIHRRLSGEETESCPLCAEMRGTGESQSVPMCHVCTLESNLEASKQGLEKLKEDLEWAVWNLAGCDVIAMGHSKPFDYAKEHARPALDSVSRMAQRLDAAESRVRELEVNIELARCGH